MNDVLWDKGLSEFSEDDVTLRLKMTLRNTENVQEDAKMRKEIEDEERRRREIEAMEYRLKLEKEQEKN